MALTRNQSLDPVADYLVRPQLPVAGGADIIYESAMVQATAAGYVVKVGDSGGAGVGPVLGYAEALIDNSGGSDGDLSMWVKQGLTWRKMDTGTPPTQADAAGGVVYAKDDNTITADPSYPVAGTCWYVEPDGVGESRGALVLFGAGSNSLSSGLILLVDEVVDYTDLTAAALFETVDLSTPIPTNAVPFIQRSKLVTPFAHGTASTATLKVGNDGDDDAYDSGGDIFTGSAYTGLDWFKAGIGTGIGAPAYDGGSATGQITATVTIDAGTVDSFTAGAVRIQLYGFVL